MEDDPARARAEGAPRLRELAPRAALYALALLGFAAVLALRLWLMSDLPMWIDETWTAVIAEQPSWRAFWREVWLDANAPLYYLAMALWPGEGNFALRLPSLLFMIGASALVLAWRMPGLSREARLTWAALLFFWSPGLLLSADARGYALLLLIAAAQAIAYARLIEAPGLKRAAWWCGLAGLAVFTHYFAAWPALVQGLFYLFLHRGRALRTLPALLVLTPLAAWGLYHLPRLLIYAQPGIAWYDTLTVETAAQAAARTLGPTVPFVLLLGLILAACRLLKPEEASGGARWTAISGAACLLILIALGMRQPFLVDRYLTPLAPSLLLGVVLLARAPTGYAIVTAWYLAAITPTGTRQLLETRSRFGLEVPSRYLLSARPDHVVYSLGYPGARVLDSGTTAQIGRYFFRRAGQRVEAKMVATGTGPDATRQLLAAATGGRPAIILLYRAGDGPRPGDIPPEWQCQDLRGRGSGILACAPRRLFEEARAVPGR